MPKYNLYRIEKNREEDLITKLKSSGLKQISEQEKEGFYMKFFFPSKPDEVDIWWVEIYKNFFGSLKPPKNSVYFGVFLISGDKISYAISLGKAHFYLTDFCDPDFGLNLAERIVDKDNIKITNSKYYKSAKSKRITTYRQGNPLIFNSGESVHYIKGKTIDTEMWGSTVNFGKSVHLNIAIDPLDLPTLIKNIENTLNQPIRTNLPKVDIIKDKNTIQHLDRILAKAILKIEENREISIEEFTISGIEFIFSENNQYSLYLKGKSQEKVLLTELSIKSLIEFVKSKNIDIEKEINNLKVTVHNEHGRNYTKPLKFYLDFIEESERYCLIDGVWHKFNQSYIKFLKEEVDKIELDYDPHFNISSQIKEGEFNQSRQDDGYLNLDTKTKPLNGYLKIEIADLYKENVLFFVKRGTPKSFGYAIDQSLNTVKILQNNSFRLTSKGERKKIKGICLWLIYNKINEIEKLSEIKSIIFHMKLVE
ncbi:MAG: TIGR04141 family sporadically distributed protein [Cyanobacteria bacterium SBLK]|nr:TIGR04141 family sporadically distributed protein [Cyanobacteria bacterium SBLK]